MDFFKLMKLTVLVQNTFLCILTLIPMVSGTIRSSMTPRERERDRRERREREKRALSICSLHSLSLSLSLLSLFLSLGVMEDRMVPDTIGISVNMHRNVF